MNPLIDVVLVLLVFFILTTTYAALQARLDTPRLHVGEVGKAIPQADVETQTIVVTIDMEDGKPVTKIEREKVHPDYLTAKLREYKQRTRKTIMLLKTQRNVPFGAVAEAQAAAAGAKMDKVYRVLSEKKAAAP
jgi:biopolymer transport protein ExbD